MVAAVRVLVRRPRLARVEDEAAEHLRPLVGGPRRRRPLVRIGLPRRRHVPGAAEMGGDPDRWVDVRAALPLLTQAKWHSRTRYGYARGHEAVNYVGNIRTYYDILNWITGAETEIEAPEQPPERELPSQREPDPSTRALDLESPIL